MEKTPLSPELNLLLEKLDRQEKLIAMLAPSFLVDFSFPEIIGQLKRLGFSAVVEVSRGAQETNRQLLDLLKKNPKGRFITNPCPSVVRLIKTQYPHLQKYLAPIKSPMVNTAELVLRKYPQAIPVFIGPCPVKKLEAKEDYPQLNIIVITYKELRQLLDLKKIKPRANDGLFGFDLVGKDTRLYPISGGLAQSSGVTQKMSDEEFDVVSGFEVDKKALEDFPHNRLKVLDILFCEGGCLNGKGIISTEPLPQRREKIIKHWLD